MEDKPKWETRPRGPQIDGGVPIGSVLNPTGQYQCSDSPLAFLDDARWINDKAMLWKTSGVGRRHRDGMIPEPEWGGPWAVKLRSVLSLINTGCLIGLAGNRGNGKTQLGAEAVHYALEKYDRTGANGGPPLMCRAMEFFLDLRSCFRPKATACERDVIRQYTAKCILILDEAHERAETEWENRMLNYMIDVRYAEKRDTIIISNDTPQAMLAALGPSIADRMRECGGVIHCDWPSFRGEKK